MRTKSAPYQIEGEWCKNTIRPINIYSKRIAEGEVEKSKMKIVRG